VIAALERGQETFWVL